MDYATPGDLRVWHIPQIPGKPFYVDVLTIEEGEKICDILAEYDLFQFDNRIKPDYANANGIERYEEDAGDMGWFEVDLEWEKENEGYLEWEKGK